MADLRRFARRVRHGFGEVSALPHKRRAIPRWAAFEAIRSLTPVVAVDHGGLRYFINTHDRALARTVFLTGGYEPELIDLAVRLVGESAGTHEPLRDRVVVDVGANIGTTLIPLVTRHRASAGLGIEPDPLNFGLLQLNVIANGLAGRVQLAQAGASDSDGTAELELSASNFGDHRIRVGTEAASNAYGEAKRSTITVPIRRLDGLVAEHGIGSDQVGLLWIDTQGHEGRVLAGANELLAAQPPICLELWPYGLRRSGSLDALLDLAASSYARAIDLRATTVSGRTVEVPTNELRGLVAQLTDERYTDVLLLP